MDASTEFARLTKARDEAAGRVVSVEAEARAAGLALAGARERLAEFERRDDDRPGDRAKLEKQLAEAEARVAQPWAQRLDGLRRRVRDHDRAVADHLRANLLEVVAPREADGAAVTERINDYMAQIMAAVAERDAIAREIGGLLAKIGRVDPGDVSRSRCGELVREAGKVIAQGGEDPPKLLRDPRVPTEAPAAEPVAAVPA